MSWLLATGAPIAIGDTLFRRRGKKVHAASWFHDGSAAGKTKLGFGNNWVVAALVVWPPFLARPIALPVLAALAVKGGRSKPDLARDLVDAVAEHFADRVIHVVADIAYGCGAFAGLVHDMTRTPRTHRETGQVPAQRRPDRHTGTDRRESELAVGARAPLRHHGHHAAQRAGLPLARHMAHRHRSPHPRPEHRPENQTRRRVGWWEPGESRGSRPVLRAGG